MRDAQPTLRLLAAHLPAGSTLEASGPAGPAVHVASDLAVNEALAAVLHEFLVPPFTSAAKAGGLVEQLCRLRPAHTPWWIGTACDEFLYARLDGAEDEIIRAVSTGAAANPAAVAQVVRAALNSITIAAEGGSHERPPLEFELAAKLIGRAVTAGVEGVRSRPDAAALIREIVHESLRLAREQQSSMVLVESLAAAVKSAAVLSNVLPADIARLAFVETATSKENAALICAAVLRGGGVGLASAVKDQAALTLSVPLAAFVTLTSNAFVAVSELPETPGTAVGRSITVTNADFIPALMVGASISAPQAAVEILISGLNRDLVLHGRATTGDILSACILAVPSRSTQLAAAAVGRGDPEGGNPPTLIAEAVARTAPTLRVAEGVAAVVRAFPSSVGNTKAIVAGAISGSNVAGRFRNEAEIVRAIALASERPGDVLDQAIASAARQVQPAAILGVLAADPLHAPALLVRALGHPAIDRSQVAAATSAGKLLIEIQRNPALFFPASLRCLGEPANAQRDIVAAIVLAAAIANPRGVHAVIAVAAAAPEAASSEELRSIAAQGNRSFARDLEPPVSSALAVARDPAAAFPLTARAVSLRPDDAAEIAAGASAARPALAAVIGEAAARAAPNEAGSVVRSLFAFSGARNPHSRPGESETEHAVSLTASVARGVVDSLLDPSSQGDAIADVVASAVRSVFALGREAANEHPQQPPPAPLTATIEAATRAAPAHALEIARAVARATRALAGSATVPKLLADAVLTAAPAVDPDQVKAAVAAGIADSDRHVPAAEVRVLSDYARDNLTGPAMSRYLDL